MPSTTPSESDLDPAPSTATSPTSPTRPGVLTPPRARPAPLPDLHPDRPGTHWGSFFLALFGVLLPLFTLGFEYSTRGSAELLFDPIPTFGHVLLVALVPLANLALLNLRGRFKARNAPEPDPRLVRVSWILAGAGVAVGCGYTVAYLPVTPFAIPGILFAGLGLLPLAPLIGLICSLRLRSTLVRARPDLAALHRRSFRRAFGLAAALLAACTAPILFTWQLASVATDPRASSGTSAIRWLRRLGHEPTLLRLCYRQDSGLWKELISRHVPRDAARELYFRVTGDAYNSVPAPAAGFGLRARSLAAGGAEWDNALGSDAVAGHVSGLSITGSRIDATCDPDAAWSYTEWTLEFRNDHATREREARAQILLPADAVVSRLTLWVNGEEREAAFAGRGQVREAYQSVAVVQRRDPVLVTTSGPDRILMQCFPVPANGGTMKVRLGITAPLMIEAPDQAVLAWPRILERNFEHLPSFRHAMWLETSRPPRSPTAGLLAAPGHPSGSPRTALRGSWSDVELTDASRAVRLSRDAASASAWATDRRGEEPGYVRQRLVPTTMPPPRRLAVVVDGSASMREHLPAIADALRIQPASTEWAVFLAHDDVRRLPVVERGGGILEVPALRGAPAEGGHDNSSALLEAWSWAAEKADGRVLWIHAPQPVALGSAAALRQVLEWRRSPTDPDLVEFAVRPGPDRLTEKLEGLSNLTTVMRLGSVGDDLARVLDRMLGSAPSFVRHFERVAGSAAPGTPGGESATGHLVRLWAADTARRLWRERRAPEAVQLGSRYQLVTPATGAVVLETKEQFARAGLQAVEASTVPTVPEPGPGTLLWVGAWILYRTRRNILPKAKLGG